MAHRIVAQNRKARHDYFILETFECGMVLTGTEIKSVRDGKLNLKDGYAVINKANSGFAACIFPLTRRGAIIITNRNATESSSLRSGRLSAFRARFAKKD